MSVKSKVFKDHVVRRRQPAPQTDQSLQADSSETAKLLVKQQQSGIHNTKEETKQLYSALTSETSNSAVCLESSNAASKYKSKLGFSCSINLQSATYKNAKLGNSSIEVDEDSSNNKFSLFSCEKPSTKNQWLSDFHDVTISSRDHSSQQLENATSIGLQTFFPFLIAGLGMVAAGIVLDKVQHWNVFQTIPEIFILVPALLGLKGNLEMTLASRLSTSANKGYFEDSQKRWSIIWGNMVVVEAQAIVIAFLASLLAMMLRWLSDGHWESEHAVILCCGSLLTGAIASGVLGLLMILVIISSTKLGINPDNVATPIAASLGDLITLSLLSTFVSLLYSIVYDSDTLWIGFAIIALFLVLAPFLIWLAYRNQFSRDVITSGWVPVISAMSISSAGGFILDFAVSKNPGIAVFSPVVNGVGGNLVAVQASRISTYLHTSGQEIGVLPDRDQMGFLTPWKTFCSPENLHAVGARVMLSMVIPGQLLFVFIIRILHVGHISITPLFVAVFVFVSLVQVAMLLQICNWLVFYLWKGGKDPDNSAIPYLTGLGDLLGTGLLSLGFLCLGLVKDGNTTTV